MTFTQIRNEVLDRMNLTSQDAQTRVGNAINRHYKRITTLLGMETLRFVTRDMYMTTGQRTVTFPDIEKIDRLFDISQPSARRLLPELSLHNMRARAVGTEMPQAWATQHVGAKTVTIALDTNPSYPWLLRADGIATLPDLAGDAEPDLPASFHDTLTWYALAEELLRKEKQQLATMYEVKANELVDQLRYQLADTYTRTLVQNSRPSDTTPSVSTIGQGSPVIERVFTPYLQALTGNGPLPPVYTHQSGFAVLSNGMAQCSGRVTLQNINGLSTGDSVWVGGFPFPLKDVGHPVNGAVAHYTNLTAGLTGVEIIMIPTPETTGWAQLWVNGPTATSGGTACAGVRAMVPFDILPDNPADTNVRFFDLIFELAYPVIQG